MPMTNFPFQTNGFTGSVGVTNSSQQASVPPPGYATSPVEARMVNIGTIPCFVRFDGVTATVNNGMPMLPGVVEIFELSPNAVINVIATTSGASTLYITLGTGT
jgi:hypothetical protein